MYKATVSSKKKTEKCYYGFVDGQFKDRRRNHTKSFRKPKYEHDTALSSYIWSLKDQEKEYTVKWEIAKKSAPYQCGGKSCNLYIAEKMYSRRRQKDHAQRKA